MDIIEENMYRKLEEDIMQKNICSMEFVEKYG